MENVIKQGYLRKGSNGERWLSGLFRRNDGQKWFVFTVREGVPFLEYYDSDVEVFTQKPINSFCLSLCRSIRGMGQSTPPTICITCPDRFIELLASSRTQMLEWVNCIQSSLIRLNILQHESEGNVYTVLPAVVRQPRVSKEVLEEREAQVAPSSSIPAQATGASSLEQTNKEAGVKLSSSESVGSTAQVDVPPPVPRRPPPSVPKSNPEDIASNNLSSQQLSTTPPDLDELSNSSDFVSWDVLMSIRKSEIEPPQLLSKTRSVSCYSSFPLTADPFSNDKSHAVNEQPPAAHHELEDSDSSDSDKSNNLIDMWSSGIPSISQNPSNLGEMLADGNDYSSHPCASDDGPEENKNHRPVPLPRRNLFLHNNHADVFACDMTNSTGFGTNACDTFEKALSDNSEVEWGTCIEINREPLIELGLEEGCDDSSTLLVRPVHDETHSKSGEVCDGNNKIQNLYSPVIKRGVSRPPSTHAPPVPPLSTSSDTASCQNHTHNEDSSKDIYRTDVTSLPLYGLASALKKDVTNSDQSTHQPVPLPRRNITANKSGKSFSFDTNNEIPDTPPLPPRRASPKLGVKLYRTFSIDPPPSLPAKTTQSFIIKRPQSFTYQDKSKENGAKLNPTGRALPPLPCANEGESSCSATSAGAADSRTSGLSHKMRLDRAHSLHTVVSLKQTQVEILQNEIDMPHVAISLTQKSGHGLALVDWNGMPCIAGWNQNNFPTLHGKLHIGDMLVSVNNIPAASPEVTQKLLRHPEGSEIEVILKRMPYAKVFAIRRNAEGQSLGLKREGGTGEIVYVDPNGLAAQHGLTPHVQGVSGGARTNWFLTEINSRPLSLFFKESEIEHRLCAVGREISIVVQPTDFILEIRRQLKKVKNYKSYIVQ